VKFYIEFDVPEDGPTISYTTDPLERCIAVATEVDGCSIIRDCTVYTAESLVLQLQAEGLVPASPGTGPTEVCPSCEGTGQVTADLVDGQCDDCAGTGIRQLDDVYDDRTNCASCGHRRYLHARQLQGAVYVGPYRCAAAGCGCVQATVEEA
jgi:hypothetical protein